MFVNDPSADARTIYQSIETSPQASASAPLTPSDARRPPPRLSACGRRGTCGRRRVEAGHIDHVVHPHAQSLEFPNLTSHGRDVSACGHACQAGKRTGKFRTATGISALPQGAKLLTPDPATAESARFWIRDQFSPRTQPWSRTGNPRAGAGGRSGKD